MSESALPIELTRVLGRMSMMGAVPSAGSSEAEHVGAEELPFVVVEAGLELQLLYVDLNTNTWVNRSRFSPGATIASTASLSSAMKSFT